ncbi:hypothetical protein QBC39DRAFT_165896 [Podospora conica]|nr:hypothetical protein QBC39DRAFT_165896 [Schizothecium conicum]
MGVGCEDDRAEGCYHCAAWSGGHLGRHAARPGGREGSGCFIDTRWPRGYWVWRYMRRRRRPAWVSIVQTGLQKMMGGHALVASICQRHVADSCIDSGGSRDSRVATASDGLAGGRCLNHRRRRFSAFRRQGVEGLRGTARIEECNLRVSTRRCRCRCRRGVHNRVGIGCRRDGCLHAAARFARPCHHRPRMLCDEEEEMMAVGRRLKLILNFKVPCISALCPGSQAPQGQPKLSPHSATSWVLHHLAEHLVRVPLF